TAARTRARSRVPAAARCWRSVGGSASNAARRRARRCGLAPPDRLSRADAPHRGGRRAPCIARPAILGRLTTSPAALIFGPRSGAWQCRIAHTTSRAGRARELNPSEEDAHALDEEDRGLRREIGRAHV